MRFSISILMLIGVCFSGIQTSQAQCPNNIISNGSFNGTKGENVTSSGWTSTSTPDLNNHIGSLNTTPGYTWEGTPLASSDGGTWQNIFGVETISQTVYLAANVTYTLSFEFAAQGITTAATYNGDVGIEVYINSSLFYITHKDSTQYTWEAVCAPFTPTNSGNYTIQFTPTDAQYAGLDGICLSSNGQAIDLGPDTTICDGDTLVLDLSSTAGNFEWQDNSSGSTFNVTQPGTYYVHVSNGCAAGRDTINVSYFPALTLDLGNDTTLCPGDTFTLDVFDANATFLWQDNSTNSILNVVEEGEYSVFVSNGCSSGRDSIYVNYLSPSGIDLGPDTVLCPGDSLIIGGSNINTPFTWQDNSTEPIFKVFESGAYYIHFSDCSITSDTVYIDFHPTIDVDLGNDSTLCLGDTLLLSMPDTTLEYTWQDNSSSPAFVVDQPGEYSVYVSDLCKSYSDTILVDYFPIVPITIGKDTLICNGFSMTLGTSLPDAKYIWQDGSTNKTITTTKPGFYWVEVDYCGLFYDTVRVEFEDCSCYMVVPNAFSPNSDNLNDNFTPITDCIFTDYSLEIYTRWGEMIYATNDINDGWDGTYKGEAVQNGVFLYLITYQSIYNNMLKTERGGVTLVR